MVFLRHRVRILYGKYENLIELIQIGRVSIE